MMTQDQPRPNQPGPIVQPPVAGQSPFGDPPPTNPLKTHPVNSQSNLVDQLRNQIRSVETAGRVADGIRVSSGCSAIDRLLPSNGYQRGTLIQWLTSGGHGADYLSLLAARQACLDGGALVLFDPLNQLYPPAIAAIGINLDNLIILRTRGSGHAHTQTTQRHAASSANHTTESQNDLLWSIDQALRCPAVAAVWGPLAQINERWFRRFQLSAESSGCLGMFVQPIRAARQPSWAEVQWIAGPLPPSCPSQPAGRQPNSAASNDSHHSPTDSDGDNSDSSEQQVRLQLTRCRGAQTGKSVSLAINTITGHVQLARRDRQLPSRLTQTRQHDSAKHDSAQPKARFNAH
ncbi:MAG: protein ImuA [Mariniblastus sp.]|jgi:protein ImuA